MDTTDSLVPLNNLLYLINIRIIRWQILMNSNLMMIQERINLRYCWLAISFNLFEIYKLNTGLT